MSEATPLDPPSTAAQDADVTRVQLDDREVLLIGTAHISQQSVDLVREILETERPDVVCVELDDERFKAMREQQKWDELDLKQVIKDGKLGFLTARLALMAFQKQMGSHTGVKPGAEMAAAIDVAESQDARLVLCDRNVRVTLLRAWRKTPFWKRSMLASTLLMGLFERTEVSEDELSELRESHNIGEILDELGGFMPEVKDVLVDERDTFMAHQIQRADGDRIAVIIGAAHKPGILRKLHDPIPGATIDEISQVPDKSIISKLVPWLVPLIIIGLFIYGLQSGKVEEAKNAALAWVLANGILCALGAIIARAHPLTIIASFFAAPITSLNPTIGAGMVAALVQVWVAPPLVRHMESVGDDIVDWHRWWSNTLVRLILVFFLTSFGSAAGTAVALYWWLPLLQNDAAKVSAEHVVQQAKQRTEAIKAAGLAKAAPGKNAKDDATHHTNSATNNAPKHTTGGATNGATNNTTSDAAKVKTTTGSTSGVPPATTNAGAKAPTTKP